MEPGNHVVERGDVAAVVMASSGEAVTYRELDARSKQLAQLLWSYGLRPGDNVAVLLENHPRYFEIYWAIHRSGLYFTPVNWHLRSEEAGFIIDDSGAVALITSVAMSEVASQLASNLSAVKFRLMIDGDVDGFERYEPAIADFPAAPLENETEGVWMLYSSGTTGRPKGIKKPLTGQPFGAVDPFMVPLMRDRWGGGPQTVYLSPAPLYHAAPMGWSSAVQRLGGTVVVMDRFEPVDALRCIERHQVTMAQFVPTHFVRMLKLPQEDRKRYDLSSLQVAVHAAAPCPPDVKEAMLAWWGPIIHEYYGGSEGVGLCAIGPEEWLTHRGSVGRALVGKVHILDDDGRELGAGEVGKVWFESAARFEYHNDPDKTREAINDRGWATIGDVGYLDPDGYLFLTDRASDMVIVGGVNVYPREAEDALTLHPAVADVAVIGVPDPEMGEQLKAIVQPVDMATIGSDLAAELITHCRERLSTYKCPRSVTFVDQLPRLPSGKVLKRDLRARFS